jgi:acyl carrier protein
MSNSQNDRSFTQDAIAAHVRREIAGILSVAVDKISTTEDIDQLGLNSSVIVSMVGNLEEHYQLRLSPTLFFENPTINAVAGALSAQLSARQKVAV